jgi:hypothetical protein
VEKLLNGGIEIDARSARDGRIVSTVDVRVDRMHMLKGKYNSLEK